MPAACSADGSGGSGKWHKAQTLTANLPLSDNLFVGLCAPGATPERPQDRAHLKSPRACAPPIAALVLKALSSQRSETQWCGLGRPQAEELVLTGQRAGRTPLAVQLGIVIGLHSMQGDPIALAVDSYRRRPSCCRRRRGQVATSCLHCSCTAVFRRRRAARARRRSWRARRWVGCRAARTGERQVHACGALRRSCRPHRRHTPRWRHLPCTNPSFTRPLMASRVLCRRRSARQR